MKKILILTAFTISLASFGNMEHRDDIGQFPGGNRLAFTRSCFKKAELIGCDVKNQTEFKVCLVEIKEQLDQD
jgi:hypothetical protein